MAASNPYTTRGNKKKVIPTKKNVDTSQWQSIWEQNRDPLPTPKKEVINPFEETKDKPDPPPTPRKPYSAFEDDDDGDGDEPKKTEIKATPDYTPRTVNLDPDRKGPSIDDADDEEDDPIKRADPKDKNPYYGTGRGSSGGTDADEDDEDLTNEESVEANKGTGGPVLFGGRDDGPEDHPGTGGGRGSSTNRGGGKTTTEEDDETEDGDEGPTVPTKIKDSDGFIRSSEAPTNEELEERAKKRREAALAAQIIEDKARADALANGIDYDTGLPLDPETGLPVEVIFGPPQVGRTHDDEGNPIPVPYGDLEEAQSLYDELQAAEADIARLEKRKEDGNPVRFEDLERARDKALRLRNQLAGWEPKTSTAVE